MSNDSTKIAEQHMPRILELDTLRGLCALAVMLYHYIWRYDAMVGFDGAPNPAANVDLLGLRDVSTIPVYIFFMISGFVIYMTLDRVKTGLEFFVSRASRLFPVYWTCVILTYLSWSAFPAFDYEVTPSQFLINLTMLQSFLYVPDVDGVYWSLGVEIVFYAAMYVLLVTNNLHRIRHFCGFWLALSTVYAIVGNQFPFYYRVVLLFGLKYAHFFVVGIVAYRMWNRRHDWKDWALFCASLATFFLHHSVDAAAAMCLFAGVFLLLAFGHLNVLAVKPLVFLGSISYALYLVHQMLGYQIIKGLSDRPIFGVFVAAVTSLALATIITLFIEKPGVRLARASYADWRQRKQYSRVI